jgi:phosphoserine phosphatase
MKQTAVEWLLSMLDYNEKMLGIKEIIEQAKEMEKDQIIDFGYDIAEDLAWGKYRDKKAMEERYNEFLTYNKEEE